MIVFFVFRERLFAVWEEMETDRSSNVSLAALLTHPVVSDMIANCGKYRSPVPSSHFFSLFSELFRLWISNKFFTPNKPMNCPTSIPTDIESLNKQW